jgi:hypothetical protein
MTNTYDFVAWGEVLIRNAKTGKEDKVELSNIPMTWNPEEISRDAAVYWAVVDTVGSQFGNDVDWFSVVSYGSSSSNS